MTDPAAGEHITRRQFVRGGVRGFCLAGLGAAAALMARGRARGGADGGSLVWQIDPEKCNKCGNCATYCVLDPSAVKCVHAFVMCGRCKFCFGYYETKPGAEISGGAESQVCPSGAIGRAYLREGDPYYEYTIDEELCIGCGKCVKGCQTFGNGSLFLQVRHDRCVNCNECSIAAACPADAFVRVPADRPYLLKGVKGKE